MSMGVLSGDPFKVCRLHAHDARYPLFDFGCIRCSAMHAALHVVLSKFLVASLSARFIGCEVIRRKSSHQCLLIMMRCLFMVVKRLARVVAMDTRVHDSSAVQIYCAHVV